jgi:hypothetical protein
LLGRLFRSLLLLALAGVVIVLAALAFFPFERFAPLVASRIERETRIETHIAALGVRIGARGAELEASGVSLRWPTGETLALDAVTASPAALGAWLRGVQTAHVTADAAFGSFEGTVSRELVRGDFTHFDFAQLPRSWFGPAGSPLAGAVDARVDLERLADQWSGSVQVEGGEGSLALPGSPVAIPYERLDASGQLDEVGTLKLESLSLAGPMVVARAHGAVEAGYAGPATGAIAIEAEIERLDPALLPALQQYGIVLDANGAGRLSISGTPDQIQIR